MSTTYPTTRIPALAAVLVLAVAPLVLLWPVLVGGRTYVPFDRAQFPPVSTTLSVAERQAIAAEPANFDVTEIPALVLPEIELSQEEHEEGRFPHWNPYARFGAPLFANGLAALVYPPNWALLLRSDAQGGLALAAYLSFLIAGLLAWRFLCEVQLGPAAALFGGLAFALSGTLLANGHFYMRMNALIWLPGMLLACLRIAHTQGRERIPGTIGLALCAAMTLLAGFPPFAAACCLMAGLYGAVQVWREHHNAGARAAVGLGGWIGGGVALGVGLAAVQLLPMLEFFPESNRTLAPSAAISAQQGFDPMGFLGYFLPDAFGHPDGSGPDYRRSPLALLLFSRVDPERGTIFFPPNYNFTEYAVFPGTLTLLLALAGACNKGCRLRWPALGIGLAFAFLAVAPAWAIWLYELPVLRNIPPMRFMGPLALIVAALAAMGLDLLVVDAGRRVWWFVIGTGLVVAAVSAVLALASPLGDHDAVVRALYERYAPQAPTLTEDAVREIIGPAANLDVAAARLQRNLGRAAAAFALGALWLLCWWRARPRPRLFAAMTWIAVAGTAVELLAFGAPLNSGRDLRHALDSPVHAFLRAERDRCREDGGITVARAARVPRSPTDLPAGSLFRERIRDLNAYAFVDRFSHRAFARLYGDGDPGGGGGGGGDAGATGDASEQMVRGIWPKAFPDDARLGRAFFDLCGLRYLLSSERLEHAGRRVGPELKGPGGEFFVYERPNALPRAFVVHRLDVRAGTPDDPDLGVLQGLCPDLAQGEPELDPRAAVLVTPRDAEVLGAAGMPDGLRGGGRAVQFRRDHPTDVVLEVAPGPPGYLVLGDSFMGGWQATVNSVPVPHARGNLFMRVVRIPAEGVEVRYTYRTPGLDAGLIVTIAALLAAMAMVLRYINSRPRTAATEIQASH